LNKKLTNVLRTNVTLYFICLVLFALAAIPFDVRLAIGEGAAAVLLLIIARRRSRSVQQSMRQYMDRFTGGMDSARSSNMLFAPLPMMVFDADTQAVVWCNDGFLELTEQKEGVFDAHLNAVVPSFSVRWLLEGKNECPENVVWNHRIYRVYGGLTRPTPDTPSTMATTYWMDVTDSEQLRQTLQMTRPVVAILMVDNYEDLMKACPESKRSAVLAQLEEKLDQWSAGADGLMLHYDRDRYLFVFEERSYSDYAPGSATAGYRAMVDEAYALAEKQKAQVDPMYHDKIDALVDRYARRLAENLNERNAIDARVPSILITGGGNFPVAKKAKQNAARDRNYGEYAEIEKLLDKIRSTGRGGISADNDLAVEKLTKKLEGMESHQAMMKAVNAYYRKHKTLEGCPELTAEQVEKVKAAMSQDWCKDPVPFPSYLLTNNNANIRRVRQRIEELSHKAEFVGWTFPGGEAKVNEAENRLQLIFADKPDVDTRQALKSEGFKWAPSQGAWQRQLNQNAIRAAARLDFLRPEDGKSPYQLQPFAKRAEKDVSR